MARAQEAPSRRPTPVSALSSRLQRLNILADVWSKLHLYHPYIATQTIDWDSVLVAAIPLVERARTDDDLVRVLNEKVFEPLGDPLSYARSREEADRSFALDVSGAGIARILAPGIGYLDATNPFDFYTANFATRVEQSVTSLGAIRLLIVDLRQTTRNEAPWGRDWLGMWLDTAIQLGPRASRITKAANTRRWMVSPPLQLEPLKSQDGKSARHLRIRVPTVFVANLATYWQFEDILDALQNGAAATVILERSGPFVESWSNFMSTPRVRYTINSPMLVSRSGELGSRPNLTVNQHIASSDLVATAQAALAAARPRPIAQLFQFTARDDTVYGISNTPLSREQRILGLIKIWETIGSFFSYLEYASIDWSNMLSTWIPRVENAESTSEYYHVLRRLSATLNDGHVAVVHPSVNEPAWSIPAVLRKVGDKILVVRVDSTIGRQRGLVLGDQILAVDDKTPREVQEHVRSEHPTSNAATEAKITWEWGLGVRGDSGTPVRLRVSTAEGIRDLTLTRTVNWRDLAIERPWNPLARVFPGNIGYLNLFEVADERMLDSLLITLRTTRGLVLDARRGGPKWSGADIRQVLTSRFMTEPVSQMAAQGTIRWMHEGPPTTAQQEQRVTYFPYRNAAGSRYDGPLAVLINERVQSIGETIVWPFYVARRATFVGTPSAGTNGGQASISLPGGGRMDFSAQLVKEMDGSRYLGVGIIPHVRVEGTQTGIRAGRDEVLERAVAFLRAASSAVGSGPSGSRH